MKLHSTLTRSVDDFTPLEDTVRIYSCGPTVYDNIHIGNLRAFIAADTLRRTLHAHGYNVQHVMNFTDVDDKTINRSHQLYPELEPLEALTKLTNTYSEIFIRDMAAINNDVAALTFTKATDYIGEMQALITALYQQGIAYLAEDGVYFSIQKYKDSGKIYGQLSEITVTNTSKQRINNDEYDKDAAHDFALWKVAKPNEPSWPFKLDGQDITGRPGWHLECSVMSIGTLGQPFDIHTGGVDLIFPHHENEIAQSTALAGNEYARFFVHNEHLLVNDQKMSKSLHNFYTLRDIEDRGYKPLVFRMLVLQSHYRSRTNFSWDNLTAAQNRLQSYFVMADSAYQPAYHATSSVDKKFINAKASALNAAMESDLDTPKALTIVSEVETEVAKHHATFTDEVAYEAFQHFLNKADHLLGLGLLERKDITSAQKQLLEDREKARASRDWPASDQLRNQLQAEGIALNDTPRGAVWYRV